MIISASFGILGILLALLFYVIRPALADSAKRSAGPLYTLVANKYYVDEVYSAMIVKPLESVSRLVLWRGVDEAVIDSSLVNGLGRVVRGWGSLFRQLQSGSIRNYATWVLAGSLLVIFVLGSGRRWPLNLLAITLVVTADRLFRRSVPAARFEGAIRDRVNRDRRNFLDLLRTDRARARERRAIQLERQCALDRQPRASDPISSWNRWHQPVAGAADNLACADRGLDVRNHDQGAQDQLLCSSTAL